MAERARRSATANDARPTVALCAGKDCQKRCEYSKMRDALDDRCVIIELKCTGICAGPVVVAHPLTDAPLVLAKIRTKRERKQFVRLVEGEGELTDRLARRTVGKSKRKSTLRRVKRAIA